MSQEECKKRQVATAWICKNFSREERYLMVFSRDMEKYLDAFTVDKFSSADKREQMRWDFFFDFLSLKEKMQEFGWSKKVLSDNGIYFKPLKNLWHRLFTEEERKNV